MLENKRQAIVEKERYLQDLYANIIALLFKKQQVIYTPINSEMWHFDVRDLTQKASLGHRGTYPVEMKKNSGKTDRLEPGATY